MAKRISGKVVYYSSSILNLFIGTVALIQQANQRKQRIFEERLKLGFQRIAVKVSLENCVPFLTLKIGQNFGSNFIFKGSQQECTYVNRGRIQKFHRG